MNGSIVVSSCFFLACVAVCAFLARRAQTRRYAVWGAVATLLTFLYAGFFYLDGAPTDEIWTQGNRYALQSDYNWWHTSRLKSEAYVRFLETGKRVYQSPNPVVPAELKGSNGVGYCVPFNGSVPRYQLPDNVETPRTVATMEEAKALWQAAGPEPLARARQLLDSNKHYEEPLRIALQQRGFAKTAWWYAMVTASFSGYLICIDWLFAKMGRALYNKRRRPKHA